VKPLSNHSIDTVDETTFASLGLSDPLLRAIADTGYETPSPIQSAAIEPLLAGHDVIGQAQTGTGKTAAFALPALQRLDLSARRPQILVLTPTRELAIQVAEAMQTYARYLPGFNVLPVYGGQGMDTQLRQLRRGVHAVVGTPGRIQDHIRRNTLDLSRVTSVVLDEADEMLRMGFVDEVEAILSHTPKEKQVALFSATMPQPIRKIAERHLRDPIEIDIKSKSATVSTVRQRFCQVTARHKLDALTRILEVEDFDGMVIFVRTKTATVELAEKLEARGFSSGALNGDMNQALRERTVDRLKRGLVDIVVATDVAARGLDVSRISHVLNYDIPYDTEAYIHRVGRTARAGRSGEAIIFVAPRETRMLRSIERATGKTIEPMALPSETDIADRRTGEFKNLITETIEAQDLAAFETIIGTYQQQHDADLGEIAAALAYLVQRERPLAPRLPPIPEQHSRAPQRGGGQPDRKHRDGGREGGRPPRREGHSGEAGMVRYRLAVGREHAVEPKHIVGAIANEVGLDSENIGRIELYERYSTVELPEGMPNDLFQHLRNVRVRGERLRIALADGFDESEGAGEGTPRPAFKAKPKTKPKTKPKRAKPKGERKEKRKNKGKKTSAGPAGAGPTG
jgi:ATP-dependent RNA helicase DeaD